MKILWIACVDIFIYFQHDGLTKVQGWHLEQIEVVNTSTKRSWIFVCGQWLSLHEGDCQISRELFAKRYSKTG